MIVCTARWTSNNNQVEAGQHKVTAAERFVTTNNSVVTAQVGASVILHCKTSSATGGQVGATSGQVSVTQNYHYCYTIQSS